MKSRSRGVGTCTRLEGELVMVEHCRSAVDLAVEVAVDTVAEEGTLAEAVHTSCSMVVKSVVGEHHILQGAAPCSTRAELHSRDGL